jgi:dTDP-3-amino-3,4,6-trideoxy-alpha-D-glucose transaminase
MCAAGEGKVGRERCYALARMPEPTILMNDFRRQWSDTQDDVVAAVREVGASGWYILGARVSSFEASLGARIGRRHAIGCANGMDALEIGLRALGLRPGERVLTTPLSAFATTLAVVRAGGVPVFVDVDRHGLLDLELAERELELDRALRFVVPVHLFGNAVELDRLQALQRRYDLRIVEDLAQAIDARSGGRPVGSVGHLGAISFYPTKNLGALGDGGAIVTDDAALDRTCRVLRDYGQDTKYVHAVLGLNSRLDELHAAILDRAFMPRLTTWTARRAKIAETYLSGIRHPHVTPLGRPAHSHSVWHIFPVLVTAGLRESLQNHLLAHDVQCAVHYPRLIPEQLALRGVPIEVRSELVVARGLTECELSLPIHPYLTDAEATRVVDVTNGWPAS